MLDAAPTPHLVLGTAQLTQPYGVLAAGTDAGFRSAEMLVVAASLGIHHLDTAPAYGEAERAIGEAGWRGSVHTKIALGAEPRASLASSLRALRRASVDVLYLHEADELTRGTSTVLEAAAELIGSGATALGASIYDLAQLDAALARPSVRVLQVPFNPLDRRFAQRALRRASSDGVHVYARSVFLQGVLLADPTRLPLSVAALAEPVARFQKIASEHGVTPAALALAWVRTRMRLAGVLIGAQNPTELSELVAAWRADVPDDALASVDAMPQPATSLVDPRRWGGPTMTSGSPSKTSGSQTKPHVVAIVQARLGSVRMPRKVLAPVLGQPLLWHLVERLRRCDTLDGLVLAIPDSPDNDALEAFAQRHSIACSRGDEHDVLARFHAAAEGAGADIVVRITGDCPMVDPTLVDRLARTLVAGNLDWAATGTTFPDGFDVEVCTMRALREAMATANASHDREHVMPYVRRSFGQNTVVEHPRDLGHVRLTLDEPADLTVIRAVFERFGSNAFSLTDVERLLQSEPALFQANQALQRNEGAMMDTGEKLWKRARQVIAGGNMLLSKRADMHLPAGWPTYFSKSSDCHLWDLDGRELLDFGFMGVGTNILGYAHPVVDEAVRAVVDKGNLTTLNCPEEVLLAERLVELHPWADMVRFTRSGGEACAVAVRIARAAAGRDGVAVCGYHGWHDWYLSANLADDEALDGHLLPGLAPNGVPRGLKGTVRPFSYNDLASLEAELAKGDIGTIYMEVERSTPPAPGFLEGVRRLATDHGAVLVFDECTSGFRKVLGGLHLHYGVEPDIVVLGKTLGNGYAINAIVGREAVMQATQSTFISSTFWTERIGPSAALATLDVMAQEDAPARIDALGVAVRAKLSSLARQLGVEIRHSGLPALTSYTLHDYDPLAVKTFVTQEMLKRGILASTVLYVALPHEKHLERYVDELGGVWQRLVDAHASGRVADLLPNGTASSGFKRLA